MPFIKIDPEALEDLDIDVNVDQLRAAGEFEYESAEAVFKRDKLGDHSRIVLEKLLAAGATTFRVKYDGGYDEGFARPDAVLFGADERPADVVAKQLTTPEFLEAFQKSSESRRPWTQNLSQDELVSYALEELAQEFASSLLGSGFGTGEYQLYGAFTADLRTGEIIDDPNASNTPDSM